MNEDFKPIWASPPGATIFEAAKRNSIPSSDLSFRLGLNPDELQDLLDGRTKISTSIAEQLGCTIGGSMEFWLARERQYREDLLRVAEVNAPESDEWLQRLPLVDMKKFGWIPRHAKRTDLLRSCLDFFAVSTIRDWREQYRPLLDAVAFRTSEAFESEPATVASWLRRAEVEASTRELGRWNVEELRGTLPTLRQLTRLQDPGDFLPKLIDLCAKCGVAVVILRSPRGCRASGATRFDRAGKPNLVLSMRHLSDDHFWFTLFHELGHLILHSDKSLFLEGYGNSANQLEAQADEFAACALIDVEERKHLEKVSPTMRNIVRFARSIGVSPGIVVGQLQHSGKLRHNQFNGLKRRYQWGIS